VFRLIIPFKQWFARCSSCVSAPPWWVGAPQYPDRAGDRHGKAYMLGMTGFATLRLNELERAAPALEEALEVFREHEDAWGSAHVLNYLAVVPLRRSEYRRAAGYAEETLALMQQTGDRFAGNISLCILAQAA
jgi:hypothetical protein